MAAITLSTFTFYLAFTFVVTEKRVRIRKDLVESDNLRNGFFIDSILNHEIVKLFSGQQKEIRKFDEYLAVLQTLAIKTTYSIGWLNIGQSSMFGVGLLASLLLSLFKVAGGSMSVGDMIAVNSILTQLQLPFNFIGYTYQELRQAYVDMSYMTNVLVNIKPSVKIEPDSPDIELLAPRNGPSLLEFKNVSFR